MMANLRNVFPMAVVVLSTLVPAPADVTLPHLFSENMVLQRDMKVPVWGRAEPGETVTVTFQDHTVSATADKDGKWRVDLPPLKAGGPFEMKVAGKNSLTIPNVLVGEVWIGSGQSNMEMGVGGCLNAEKELASADFPNIRLMKIPHVTSPNPEEDVSAGWSVCRGDTVAGFSAVAYFFGRELHKTLGVPVGLIDSSWGGSAIEPWCNDETFVLLDQDGSYLRQREMIQIAREDMPKAIRMYLASLEDWEKAANCFDEKNEGFEKGWADPETPTTDWQKVEKSDFNFIGAMWFRREVTIPRDWVGKELELSLGVIDDYDTTYFNGIEVGQTDKKTQRYWDTPRVYRVPAHCVKAGKNVIAVRVFNNYIDGWFGKDPAAMKLQPIGMSTEPISLGGSWICKEERRQERKETPLGKPLPPSQDTGLMTAMYNGMIHPLIPYAIRGVLWYQGESNAGNAVGYRTMFPAMIQSWRKVWGEGDFPFLFVQLASFTAVQPEPGISAWAELREAQEMTLSVPNTGMAVAIDIGDANDIHPKNKQDVGKRLALWALAKTFGKDLVYSGPIYKEMKVEGDKVRLTFDYADGGLVAQGDGGLKGFAIAGADGKFVWADAKIDGETVLVWSDKVPQPAAVRYAWATNPICNLYNKAGLPASPFRTDRPQ